MDTTSAEYWVKQLSRLENTGMNLQSAIEAGDAARAMALARFVELTASRLRQHVVNAAPPPTLTIVTGAAEEEHDK